MKRDDVVLPIETEPPPHKPRNVVQEGMHHYYNRDPEALRAFLARLQDLLIHQPKEK
jgi:hypothetical protein